MELAPGSVFAGYQIVRLLGRGGMGAVYLARHPRLPREDALKILGGALSGNAAFRARFEREADVAASLRHPNIVSVYDRGTEGEQLWISMQYIEVNDASDLIAAGPGVLTVPRVIDIIGDVAKALDYAHRNNVLHRDVKPANILVAPPVDRNRSESAMLTDFGIAKAIASTSGLTLPGDILGTLAYAAPEQLTGRPVDHRADVYALGCTLYEMLTGAKPYPLDDVPAVMAAHLGAPPPVPSRVRRGLPPGLDRVVARALAKDPNRRYGSCQDLAEDAAMALHSAGVPTRPPRPAPPMPSNTASMPPAGGMRVSPNTGPAPVPHTGPQPQQQPPQRSRRGLMIGVSVVGVVALIATGVVIAVASSGGDDRAGPTATSSAPKASRSTSTAQSTTAPAEEAPPAGPTARAATGAFAVTVPVGWNEQPPTGELKLKSDNGRANVLVKVNSGEGSEKRGATVEESAELNAQVIADGLGGIIDPGGFEATTVDGEPAMRFTYSLPVNEEKGIKQDARGRQLYVRHENAEYIVTFTGGTEAFNLQVANYEAIMDSWRWLN